MEIKKRLIKTMVWSVILYAPETWTLQKKDITGGIRNVAMEDDGKDQMARQEIKRRGITIYRDSAMVGEQRSIINAIKRRQRNWIGHC